MTTTQRHRPKPPASGPLVPLLFALALGCLLVAGYAMLGKGTKSMPVRTQSGDPTQNATNGDITSNPDRRSGQPQATPNNPQTQALQPGPSGTLAVHPLPTIVTTQTSPDTRPANSQALSVEEERPLSPLETLAAHPYFVSANDYAALRQALWNDDYLAARIALNDLTLESDSARQVVEHLFEVWPTRFALIADHCANARVPVNLNDPVTGKLGKVVGASKEGLTLENGLSTQLVLWNGISRKDYVRLWLDIAQSETSSEDARLTALVMHLLAQDFVTCRLLMLRLSQSAFDASGLQALVTTVERWTILRTAMDVHIARQNQDRATEDQLLAKLKQLTSLSGNDWAVPILAGLSQPAPSQAVTDKPAATLIAISGLNRPMALMGNWAPDRLGTRCVGGGEVRVSELDQSSEVELVFTPIAYQGGLRLTLKNTSITIDFSRSMLDIKAPQRSMISVPVTLFPRYQNSLLIQFSNQQEGIQIRINRDQPLVNIPAIRGLTEMILSLSGGSDIRLHKFSFK